MMIKPDPETDVYYRTYEFYSGETLLAKQIVKEGETLLRPAAPETDIHHKFIGWQTADGSTFNGFGKVTGISKTETVTLTAAFEEVYYVFFVDNDGITIATESGAPGKEILANKSFPVGKDQKLIG